MTAVNVCAGLPNWRTATLRVHLIDGTIDRFRDECSKHGCRAPYNMTYEYTSDELIVSAPSGERWSYPKGQVRQIEVTPRNL